MSNDLCAVCGGSVAWDPEVSAYFEDKVCYSCGFHAQHPAASKIRGLRQANDELTAALDASQRDLEAAHEALASWRRSAAELRSQLIELGEQPFLRKQALSLRPDSEDNNND